MREEMRTTNPLAPAFSADAVKRATVVTATYVHPEALGPHLTSALKLAELFGMMTIVARNVMRTEWEFPPNVELVTVGRYLPIRASEQKPAWWKAVSFLRFAWMLFRQIRRKRPAVVVLYDPIPLLAFGMFATFLRYRPKVWYHNWDILEANRVRKYSVAWFAAKREGAILGKVDLFSLPIDERKPYFNLEHFRGTYLLIPNYPIRSFYGFGSSAKKSVADEMTIVYAGTISEGHGFDEVIKILNRSIGGRRLKLVLRGHLWPAYREVLLRTARESGVEDRLSIIPAGAFKDVIPILQQADVGLAIYTGNDLMNRTMFIGPSKIYEYIAVGLPVILHDAHWRASFSAYKWAVPTDLSPESLVAQLTYIVQNYEELSAAAAADFASWLNCDRYYEQAVASLFAVSASGPIPAAVNA